MADDHVISYSKQIANDFNEYFISICDDTDLNEPLNHDYITIWMNCLIASNNTVHRLINNSKISDGIVNISNKLFKYL